MSVIDEIDFLVKTSGAGTSSVIQPANGSFSETRPIDRKSYEYVYDFYKDIAPAIRMRELGTNHLSKDELDAFDSLRSIPVELGRLKKGQGGLHLRTDDGLGTKKIILSNDKDMSGFVSRKNLAHELRHALARRIKPSRKSTGFLNSIYGFLNNGVDINPQNPGYHARLAQEEMFTTNKEHQYKVYEILRDRLGRRPTSNEYFSEVDKIPKYELYNLRKNGRNDYQTIADKIMGALGISGSLDKFREALKSISMSKPHTVPGNHVSHSMGRA